MNKPTFNTTPRFTELSIETGKVYTVRYWPSGVTEYLVNLAPVAELPKTPATKVLLEAARTQGDNIKRLYSLPFDGQEYRQLWYTVKTAVEG